MIGWVISLIGWIFWIWIIWSIISYFVDKDKNKELKEEKRDYKRISKKDLEECDMGRRFPLLNKELKEIAWKKESKDFKTLKENELEKLGIKGQKKRFPILWEKVEEANKKSPLHKEMEKFDAQSYKERKNFFTNLDYDMSKEFPLLAKEYEKEFGYNERARKELIVCGKLTKKERKKCNIQKEFPEFYKSLIKDSEKGFKNKIKKFVFGEKND